MDTVCHDIEVEDLAIAVLKYKNGAYGRLLASTATNPGQGNIFEFYGPLGTAVLADGKLRSWCVSPSKEELATETITTADTKAAGAASSSTGFDDQGHIDQVANFVAAIRRDEPLICTGEEGLKSVHLILALYESARSGREINLDEMLEQAGSLKSSSFD
jgi:predicted dehydrogenase